VAILGVSKTQIKPVYINNAFVPRQMLPFSLCYDHRAVNGVDAGNFVTRLAEVLSDIRLLLL
jgi:pyruvate dehydrogenase E2 component (dihydrolipoamide acetyltransferase)